MMGAGIWYDVMHNFHREGKRTAMIVDGSEKERGTVNAGQTSVTRVGAPYVHVWGLSR